VVAGAHSLEDGAKLAALRAKSLIPLNGNGEKASFALSAEENEPLIAP
jgi:acyl transferase domain-containing protein